MKLRIGLGSDIHQLQEGLPMLLGGVRIVSNRGFVAHSDGDIVLHALIDALLGALALGDIGDLFPPTNPLYRGASSTDLLKQTLALSQLKEWEIVNIDIIINLETPKLSSYKEEISRNVASLLSVSPTTISVKAKTAEGLDAIGHGLSASAQCIILLSRL